MKFKQLYLTLQKSIIHPHNQSLYNHQYIKHPITTYPKPIIQSSNLFTSFSLQNSTNWSQYIRNCISNGQKREALLIYNSIRRSEVFILGIFPLIVKACASLSTIEHGKSLHADLIKMGIVCDKIVGTSLVDMYAKCGCIVHARNMFDEMIDRNVVTFNAMIGGYVRNGDMGSALLLFDKMLIRSSVTWIEMIVGFANIGDTMNARKFFDQVPVELRTVVTWSAMVDGYARNGEMDNAKQVFKQMEVKNCFVWSSLITGYCRKGDVQEAKNLFAMIPERNLVNWNSLISGLSQNGYCEEALYMFRRLQREGFKPDEVTLVSVLSSCGQLGLLKGGKEIHLVIIQKGIETNQFLSNGLVDMYAKCGDLDNARVVFERMPKRNDSCWNAMISGFAIHGQTRKALSYFHRMESSAEKPNEITYLSVLSACAHGGLVEEGLEILAKMEKHSLNPGIRHYGCVIDLLGRAGRLQEAYNLVKNMPVKPNDTIWGALLGACRIHSDTDMAEYVMKEANGNHNLVYSNDPHYVLLSNIFAASDRWEKAERMRIAMLDKGLVKTPGRSSCM